MSRELNFEKYGVLKVDELPVIAVSTSMADGELAGKFDIGFAAVELDGEMWIAVVTNTPSRPEVLAAAPNSPGARKFLSDLISKGEYRIAVSYNQVLPEVSDSEKWYEMEFQESIDGDVYDYLEHKQLDSGYEEDLRVVQDALTTDASSPSV